jgi:hypothetical protein
MVGDEAGFIAARDAWYAHADETATFLAGANAAWPEETLKAMLYTCVDDALAEAAERLAGDWAGEVDAHDALATQARAVADALGTGIALQFP